MQARTNGQDKRTSRRWDVFDFIVRFKRAHDGNSPSLREIGEGCHIASPSVSLYHVRQLQADGVLHLRGEKFDKQRIEVVGGRWTYEKP